MPKFRRTRVAGVLAVLAAALAILAPAPAAAAPTNRTPAAATTTTTGGTPSTTPTCANAGSGAGAKALQIGKAVLDFLTQNFGDLASMSVGDASKSVTCGVMATLFPTTSDGFTTSLIQSLVASPNYTQEGTNIASLGQKSAAIGAGVDAFAISVAIIEFFLMGVIRSGGGMSGAEGIARGAGAALLIWLLPWGEGQLIAFANALSASVISGGTHSTLGKLLAGTLANPFALPGIGLAVGVILFLFGLILMIGLLLMKMAMGAALAVAYVVMPVAVALGVMPSMAWLPRFVFKGMTSILLIPFVWAVIFAVFAAFGSDAITFGNLHLAGGSVWGQLLTPLITILLLLMLIFLPLKLAKVASLSSVLPGGGGSVGRTFAGSFASRAAWAGIRSMTRGGEGGRAGLADLPGISDEHRERLGNWEKDFSDTADEATTVGNEAKATTASNDERHAQRSHSAGFGARLSGQEFDRAFEAWEQAGFPEDAKAFGPEARQPSTNGTRSDAGRQGGLGAYLSNADDETRRARGAAIGRADSAFGDHEVDPGRLDASRSQARRDLAQYRTDINNVSPDEAAATFEVAVDNARQDLDTFSPAQQSALADVYENGGIETFAFYTSHLTYSDALTPEQADAAQSLSGADSSVLAEVLPPTDGPAGGSATAPAPDPIAT